jgi:hypothetical protein
MWRIDESLLLKYNEGDTVVVPLKVAVVPEFRACVQSGSGIGAEYGEVFSAFEQFDLIDSQLAVKILPDFRPDPPAGAGGAVSVDKLQRGIAHHFSLIDLIRESPDSLVRRGHPGFQINGFHLSTRTVVHFT